MLTLSTPPTSREAAGSRASHQSGRSGASRPALDGDRTSTPRRPVTHAEGLPGVTAARRWFLRLLAIEACLFTLAIASETWA